jgi:hypothetical protein
VDAANSHHLPGDIHVAKTRTEPAVQPLQENTEKKEEKMKIVKTNPETVDEGISTAMFISQIYGSHSPEARLAWELVEEMEAAASHKKARDTQVLERLVADQKEQNEPSEIAAQFVHADSEAAVKEALEASKKYGVSSKEARLAWETVEEVSRNAVGLFGQR